MALIPIQQSNLFKHELELVIKNNLELVIKHKLELISKYKKKTSHHIQTETSYQAQTNVNPQNSYATAHTKLWILASVARVIFINCRTLE